ncbi:hypothetical protein Afil01_32500 [Actinorhabdospora filicis]|uniref:Class I SAM-dependent methyltransferase n=1 Tax=Actinorhabdospora filicis TaxID=1785913 RepID=A0A9W6W9X6_9ACTN|nr:methyltransferase domain-containing protein [Actinorhabdospora filicis]GLZ78443.1 hypothetical protein Afil01_32500 [Actinorhabdospora filicis]
MYIDTESTVGSAPSTRTLMRAARRLYPGPPSPTIALQRLRPAVCPLDRVLQYVPADARVLDVGCGGGLFLGLLAASGRRVSGHGVDMSASAIAIADAMAARVTETGSVLTFECQDATTPWPRGEYDVVSMLDLLHHVPPGEQRAVFAKAVAALRPGGTLLYKDMATRPRWRAAANQLHDLVLARQWIHHVALDEVRRWAVEEDLDIVHFERINRLWYGHELLVLRRSGS